MKTYFRNFSPLQVAFSLAIMLTAALLFATGMHDALLLAPAAALSLEDLAAEFTGQSQKMAGMASDLKEAHAELAAKHAAGERVSKELKEQIDGMLTKFNGLKEAVNDMEQKLTQRVEDDRSHSQTWGEQFVHSEAYKSAGDKRGDQRGKVITTEVKQINSTAAGGLIRSQRESGVVSLERERRVVRDLLTTVPVSTSSVEYAVQTTRTNNAAPVAEAAAKPYSDFAWSQATVNVRTLAHLAKITRQAMDDAPRLIAELDSEMRYGLGYVEERQFLYGSGVGQNLHGIVPQAAAFAVPAGVGAIPDAQRIDVLRLAMLQVALGLLPADGIVLNPLDWAVIELTKTGDGAYLFANPQGTVDARMWGLPVVATPAMDAGDFLVGNFKMGATVYDRMGVEVLISTENADDFEKNLATMRAEERVAIAVKRTYAFVTGDFTSAIADAAA